MKNKQCNLFLMFLLVVFFSSISAVLNAQEMQTDTLTAEEAARLDSIVQKYKHQYETPEEGIEQEDITTDDPEPADDQATETDLPELTLPDLDLGADLETTAMMLLQELLVKIQTGELDESLSQIAAQLNEHYTPEKVHAYVQEKYGDLLKFDMQPNSPPTVEPSGIPSFDYTVTAQFSKVPVPVKVRIGLNAATGEIIFEDQTFSGLPPSMIPDYREPEAIEATTENEETYNASEEGFDSEEHLPVEPETPVYIAQMAQPFFTNLQTKNYSVIYQNSTNGFKNMISYVRFTEVLNDIYNAGNLQKYYLHEYRESNYEGTPVMQLLYLLTSDNQYNFVRLNYLQTTEGYKLMGVYFNK